MCQQKRDTFKRWDNFNKYQIEQHQKQIEMVGLEAKISS
jgi:hypothetical protein